MRIAVIGLGKLGAPLAAILANAGHEVCGVDKHQPFVDAINAGKAPVAEPGLTEMIAGLNPGALTASIDFDCVRSASMSMVVVPTPSGPGGAFINDHVIDAVSSIGRELRGIEHRHAVVICSTVMPGSTDGPIRSALKLAACEMTDERIALVYSPEFIALGSVLHDMANPDVVLIGSSVQWPTSRLFLVIRSVVDNRPSFHFLSTAEAEVAKLAVNQAVTMKISFANVIAEICEALPGADARRVTAALGADSRIGTKYLTPATAYAGPCFPRDSRAFAQLARSLGASDDLSVATTSVNRRQVERLIDMVRKLDNGAGVGVLGLSYKPGTSVTDESVGVAVATTLASEGRWVKVFDPLAAFWPPECGRAVSMAACVAEVDVVVVTTAHPEFATVKIEASVVIDCWGIVPDENVSGHIIRLGVGEPS